MIVLYKGSRGKGKTLTMVKDAFHYYKRGYKVLANFNMKFGDYISSNDVLALDKTSELMNCVLVLDELQIFFDSRNFRRKENIDFSNFIQQIRKRNVHILGTTQYVNAVELRFRQHIDIVVYPHFDKISFYCRVYYFDISILEDDLEDTKVSPSLIVYNARPIFDLYDTYEMLR